MAAPSGRHPRSLGEAAEIRRRPWTNDCLILILLTQVQCVRHTRGVLECEDQVELGNGVKNMADLGGGDTQPVVSFEDHHRVYLL